MHEDIVPGKAILREHLKQLIERCFGNEVPKIVDRHGKSLRYIYGQKAKRFQGDIIGVGDAIPSANPLAFEGIRHAMMTSRFAVQALNARLDGKATDFSPYFAATQAYFGWRWRFCETIMRMLYRQKKDYKVDRVISVLNRFSFDQLLALFFDYAPSQGMRFFWRYGLESISPFC